MDPMAPVCGEPNTVLPEPDGADLNKAIEFLCDWMHDTGIVIRYLSARENGHKAHIDLSLGKSVDGKDFALTKTFSLGWTLSSANWTLYTNDLALEYMVDELKQFPKTKKGSDSDQ